MLYNCCIWTHEFSLTMPLRGREVFTAKEIKTQMLMSWFSEVLKIHTWLQPSRAIQASPITRKHQMKSMILHNTVSLNYSLWSWKALTGHTDQSLQPFSMNSSAYSIDVICTQAHMNSSENRRSMELHQFTPAGELAPGLCSSGCK